MPRYGPIWLEIARQQYDDLPSEVRELVNRRIGQLIADPHGDVHAVYDARSDQWSIPLEEHGFLLYAVTDHPKRVIVLRIVVLG